MSTEPPTTLLPCPFCGGDGTEASETDETSGTCFWVECGSGVCGGRTDPFFTLESAIEAWNTRTASVGADAAEICAEMARTLKSACRIHTAWTIGRYLMANAEGRLDGAEKAERHRELVLFYVALFRGGDPDYAGRDYPDDYERLHEASQELTDYMDEVIGFPVRGMPDYQTLEPKFFEKFHSIAISVLSAAALREAERRIRKNS